MRNRIFLIVILAFVFSLQGSSQMKRANKLFEVFKYSEAIPFYLKVVKSNKKTDKKEATEKLADCYRFNNDVAEARFWYEKAVAFDDADPIDYFYLGQALRGLELYDLAADAFLKFSTTFPDSLDAGNHYQYCIDIQSWLELPDMAEVKNVENINSKYSDFGPAIYNKEIIFTSDRRLDVLDNNTYGWTNFSYLDIYNTQPDNFGSFWSTMSMPKSMAHNFNQSYHDGPATFSSDNKQVYITKTVTKEGEKDKKGIRTYLLKIFYANIKEGRRLKYKPFFLNSNKYSVAHPTLSKNSGQIIFSSDLPGGFGGSDLYVCTLEENGEWGDPVNLGEKINSKGDEVFPYWANDSTLFYSSDGLMGFGGLDIFQTNLLNNEWSVPENLKKPLNSSYDDFGVLFSENFKDGLFSSNRPGGKGSDDIYAFKDLKYVPKKIEIPELIVSGYVKELATNKPINEATVFLFDPTTNNVLILKSDKSGYYETTLEYEHSYVVKAMKNGYTYDCTTFLTPEAFSTKESQEPRDLLITKLEVNRSFTVKNIYYDLDKWFIRKDAELPLNNLVQILKEYPTIVAELSSHTDSRGSHEYNVELSQKRAESAVRYIVLQGISSSRITAKGYGETKLVNECADGVSCTEEQHQANRRTVFKIAAIDESLAEKNLFNPDDFGVGDIINVKLLKSDFFSNCLVKKESLKDYLLQPVKQ